MEDQNEHDLLMNILINFRRHGFSLEETHTSILNLLRPNRKYRRNHTPEGFEKRLQEQSKKLDEWQRLIDEKLKRI